MTRLADSGFDSLYDGPATVPGYDRSAVRPGIVHLGVGAFFRAHQAWYTDRLLAQGGDTSWGITGVGVLPMDRPMADALHAQDGRYTLLMKDSERREARVIGSVVEYLLAPDDPQAVIDRLAAPETRIVTLTVTEGGYYNDPNTGEFLVDHPDIAHDVAHPDAPRTHLGLIAAALRLRRERSTPPPTLLTCDNIQDNGHVFRRAMVNFARLLDDDLAAWIDANVSFPNTMVDRITPRTTDADRAEILRDWGIEDRWPVVSETFAQWVVQDDFPTGRPEWEKVGVQLVEDVTPFELLKLRILNTTHQLLAYLGFLSGYTYVDEACADPTFAALMRAYMEREGYPTLQPVPDTDVQAYGEEIIRRFSNTEIKDTLARLCTESSTYVSTFVFPVLRDNLAAGGQIDVLALVVAAWARFMEGVDEKGDPVDIIDRRAAELIPLAQAHRQDPSVFVAGNPLFGDIGSNERFLEAFAAASESLRRLGAHRAMEELLARLGQAPQRAESRGQEG